MQVDQREALEDPRPVVGIMAHAYANPLLNNSSRGDEDAAAAGRGGGEEEGALAAEAPAAASAEEAANELVIDALLAVEAETIGPEVRFLGLPRGTSGLPGKKPGGGAWRGADGLRVVEGALPRGLVKRGWLHKHTRQLPGSLVYLASVDVSAGAEDWADTEDEIVADLRGVVAAAAARDVKVLLVLVRAGAEAGQSGGREERDVTDERALSLRRRAEIDARLVLMIGEPDLATRGGNKPPSVRRIAKAAKDLAVAHYASHISRLRRWEKVLVPTQRLYRPLLARLYFKLGVLHEMQGLVDRSVLCYQEVAALLSDMVPRDGGTFPGGSAGARGYPDAGRGGGESIRNGADPMEQIRGVSEVVHLRLVRNHLHRNMSVEGAIRQLRRHVSAFGRPFGAATSSPSPSSSSSSPSSSSAAVRNGTGSAAAASPVSAASSGGAGGGGSGSGEREEEGEGGVEVVPYRHHAWLSRQYLVFGEMLGAHMSQFPAPTGGVGGALGYTSPGYYYLGAALQAVRRRKTSARLFRDMDEAKLRASLEVLEVREPSYLGESVRLADPGDPARNLRRECRAFLDLEEAATDRVDVARSLLVKALEHCPLGVDSFRRRRVLILSHLGEESFVAGRHEEALERLPSVWETYLADGWLQLAAVTLRRVYDSAWCAGKARTAADMSLRLASKALRPWVPADEAGRLLAEALPLVGALGWGDGAAAPVGAGGAGRRGFVASVPPEGEASEELQVTVDSSRLLLRLSGRFSVAEASGGDGLVLRVALLSLLPLETRLEGVELSFNHAALNCTIRDSRTATATATATATTTSTSTSTSFSPCEHSADLTLPAGGLLTAEVGICLPWEALPSSETLRLVEARALMKSCGGGGGGSVVAPAAEAAAGAGVALVVAAGPGSELARETGGETWARVPGYEAVRLVPPRARARVRITEPSSVLLGLVTRLLVTVSAMPKPAAVSSPGVGGGEGEGANTAGQASAAAAAAAGGGGGAGRDGCCGKPPHPFRGGFLHVECEPAPVPPPLVTPHPRTTTTTTAADDHQHQEGSPPSSPPPPPPQQAEPARPRPDRAFFWAPPPTPGAAAAAAVDGKGGFLPVMVGSDGQPVEGIPLPLSASSSRQEEEEDDAVEQVTVPVWVRSETAGKVAVRARVVYGLEGKPPTPRHGAGAGDGEVEEGIAVTEWARAEVLCVRPLASVVDVVSLQASEDRSGGGGDASSAAPFSASERSGHTVAVKVSVTNLQEKRLIISRLEVVPPSAALPPPASSTPTAAAAAAAGSSTAATATDDAGKAVKWATLPHGPVLYDETAAAVVAAGHAAPVALPGTGDSYTCCFSAKGYAGRPAPLGKLRVTWRPRPAAAAATGDGDSAVVVSSPPVDQTAAAAAAGAAVTEFSLPVLSARPPALSARLKAPPHARVGEEFSMSWEISNLTAAYSSVRLTAEDGGEFVWSGKRLCMLQVAPMETVSVVYRLVPKVPGHVLLPTVAAVPVRENVNVIPDLAEGRPHIFVRP